MKTMMQVVVDSHRWMDGWMDGWTLFHQGALSLKGPGTLAAYIRFVRFSRDLVDSHI